MSNTEEKNPTLSDINLIILNQMKKLSAMELDMDQLKTEAVRVKSITSLSQQFIKSTGMAISASKLYYNQGILIEQIDGRVKVKQIQ